MPGPALTVAIVFPLRFLAADEAVLATGIWQGTGALIGGALRQAGALLLYIVMLRSGAFGKVAAWIGIAMYGLDLLHVFAMPVLPQAGTVLMMVAGPLYPVWFLLVGLRLQGLAAFSEDQKLAAHAG